MIGVYLAWAVDCLRSLSSVPVFEEAGSEDGDVDTFLAFGDVFGNMGSTLGEVPEFFCCSRIGGNTEPKGRGW